MSATLRQVMMIIIEVALFLLIMASCYGLIYGIFSLTGFVHYSFENSSSFLNPYEDLLFDYIPLLIASAMATIVVHRQIFKRKLSFSGITRIRMFRDTAYGFLWSALLIAMGFLLLYLSQLLIVENVAFNFSLFLGFLLFFLTQSSVEEIMLRSFLLPTIASRLNVVWGLLLSSLLFTCLHVFNPNVTLLSLINIFLAGLMLGILFLKTKSIWAPIGLHMGWNFLQGSFFGFEVSGLDVYSFIDSKEVGHDLLTGGSFGFEGSILATAMMIITCWYFGRKLSDEYRDNVYLHERHKHA